MLTTRTRCGVCGSLVHVFTPAISAVAPLMIAAPANGILLWDTDQ